MINPDKLRLFKIKDVSYFRIFLNTNPQWGEMNEEYDAAESRMFKDYCVDRVSFNYAKYGIFRKRNYKTKNIEVRCRYRSTVETA